MIRDALQLQNYSGWVVVAQDVFSGLGAALASAPRNRDYWRHLGL